MAKSFRNRERFMGDSGYLIHFGIKGQKWGVRRFQNEDGSLTEEGKIRYLGISNANAMNVERLYNEVVDRSNKDLKRINKKYDNVDLTTDDRANLEYTKEVLDSWQKNYRDVLAKDIGTDPSTLQGQKWLDEVYGYRSNMDTEIESLEKKINASEKKKSGNLKGSTKRSIPDYDDKMARKIKENYSPKEIKNSVNSIVEYFKGNGIDILREIKDDKNGRLLKDADVNEQFYILMRMFDETAFDDLD